ncbi:MAG: hypothetical protein IKR73_03500 [Oscillospiraceae bacterium]|nr:hypothetical protein [Oscillospiraceae bacterium]
MRNITKCISAVICAVLMTVPCTAYSGVYAATDPVTRREIKEAEVPKGAKGTTLINGRMYYVENGKAYLYTGTVKDKDGVRFYYGGSRWFGWMKISGQWYYFDPAKTGLMAKGSFTTAAGTYKVSASGAWTGDLSKDAKMAEDLRIVYETSQGGCLVFDTDGTITDSLTADPDDMERHRMSVDVDERDKQIMYDMLISTSLDKSAANSGKDFKITVTRGKDKITIGLDDKTYEKYGTDKAVTSSAYYRTFIESYIHALPQYSRLESEKTTTPGFIMPKLSVTRKIKADIHKYSGSYGIDKPRTCVLNTLSGAKTFAAERDKLPAHKGKTYVAQLKDIDADLFDKKVIIYTEYKGHKGDKFAISKATYDSENNVYSAEVAVVPGSGAEAEYVLLIEADKPADASPVVPIGQIVFR